VYATEQKITIKAFCLKYEILNDKYTCIVIRLCATLQCEALQKKPNSD